MTLQQVVKAYTHIEELSKSVFPYQTSRSLFRLKKRLREEFDVVLEMEEALVAEYDGAKKQNGAYKFPTEEKQRQFIAAYDELMTKEQDIKLPVVDLSKYTGMIRISAAAMEALDGLILFEEANQEKDGEGD